MKEEKPSFNNCVNALMKFNKKVLEPFYTDRYTQLNTEQKIEWDKALYNWAIGTKPTENVTMRLGIIVRVKLVYLQKLSEIQYELRWLSMNGDKRSIREYESIRDSSKESNLLKLLALDLSSNKYEKRQLEKMFSILFAESAREETQKLYEEFRMRNGFAPQKEPAKDEPIMMLKPRRNIKPLIAIVNEKSVEMGQNPASEEFYPVEAGRMPVEMSQAVTVTTAKPSGMVTSSEENEPKSDEVTPGSFVESSELGREAAKGEKLQDGLVLAEALVGWVRKQKESAFAQSKQIFDKNAEIQQLRRSFAQKSSESEAVKKELAATDEELRTTKSKLAEAEARIKSLEDECVKANETIRNVQKMSGNSVKQELDGYKHSLAAELRKTAKDFAEDVSDFSDSEKLEMYKALLEEMFDILQHGGVVIEVN